MDKVRIGIIGLGGMGSSHATYLSQGQIAGAELAAVADVDPARLAGVQEKYGESVQAFAGGRCPVCGPMRGRCNRRYPPLLPSPAGDSRRSKMACMR